MSSNVRKLFEIKKGFVIDYLMYVLFFVIVLFKLFLFSRYTGSAFFYNGVAGYFLEGFRGLSSGEGFQNFYRGLFLVSAGALLLLSFWTVLLKKKEQFIALFLLNAIISVLAFADLIYYRYFSDLLSVGILAQANQTGAIKDSILGLIKGKDMIFFIDFLVWIPLMVIFRIKKIKWKNHSGYFWRGSFAAIALITGYLFISAPINNYITKYGDVLFKQVWYNMSVYNQTGLLGFHIFDTYKTIDENVINKKTVSAEEAENVKEWFEQHQTKLEEKSPFYGTAKGKNVIIVQLEAFNSFFINKSVNGQEITPNINKLIKESLYFNQFYHQTAQGRTSDAEFQANQSLHPLSAGSVYVKYANRDFDSLPAILKENGYETAAFHAYDKSFWNRYAMYNNHGFNHFYGDKDFAEGEIAGWTLGDKPFFQQSIDKMLKFDKPFYAFLVALSSHHPYDIQSKYKVLDLTGYEGIFANYLHSVHYVDAAVGEMVERLKAEGLWDESVLMLYGDHDYGVKENEMLASVAGTDTDPLTMEQLYNQIPFIIHLPNDEGKGLYENSGGQMDIAPTVMHLLGIEKSPLYMMGNNLTDGKNNLVAFRYGSFTNGEVFYKASQDLVFENGTCYDLETRDKTDVQACKAGFDETQKRLKTSDQVLIGDLIKKMRKQGEE